MNDRPDEYPWLRVPGPKTEEAGGGSLYVSCPMNGNNSVQPLLKDLANRGRSFIVVAGRHGRESGNLLKGPGSTTLDESVQDGDGGGIDDRKAVDQIRPLLQRGNTGTVVSYKDSNAFQNGQTSHHLKAYAKEHLNKGVDVIFAWCYSLSSMRDTILPPDKGDLIAQDSLFVDVPFSSFEKEYNWDTNEIYRPSFRWRTKSVNYDSPPSPEP